MLSRISLLFLLLWTVAASAAAPANVAELKRSFAAPPDEAKPMMRWWWFGPSVTKAQLEKEMRLMKEGGIGGFEVQPTYPLVVDDPSKGIRNLPFLSPEFLDMLKFTAEKAKELGLRFDLTLGSGWPFGGPMIPIEQASGRLQIARVPVSADATSVTLPTLPAGARFIAAVDAATGKELTGISDGKITIAQPRPKEVLVFSSGHTRMMVKRPAVGSEGLVLDHYARPAIDNYLTTVGDKLMSVLGSNKPYAIFCDSLEVAGEDWTYDFLDQFKKRRGYDLKPYLHALVNDIGPKTLEVRYDWGRTMTELYEENFLAPMRDWSKKNGTLFRIQGYGSPPAILSSFSYSDFPEGEGHQWRGLSMSRWASSAAHVFNRAAASSETWTWLHSPVFRATPLDMKAEADIHFLQGITQLIGHGWPYTSPGIEYPGWRFYASAVFNEKNPWWVAMPDISQYLQRNSFLLRQGRPANDVAVYLPEADTYASFTPGRVGINLMLGGRVNSAADRVLAAGYGLDFIDDGVLVPAPRSERGTLSIGAGRYRILVLPNVERIPLASLRKIEEFVNAGGHVVATRRTPSLVPGFQAAGTDQAELRAIVARLFEGPSAKAKLVTDEAGLPQVLNAMLPADVALATPSTEIGFVHRSLDFAEAYFIANTSNTAKSTKATFRVAGMQPEWFDSITGQVTPAAMERGNGTVTVQLDLAAYESKVLVFSKQARQFTALPPTKPAGAPLDLSSGWKVTFDGSGLKTDMAKLASWTDDERTRFYSGTATYEKDVTVPAAMLARGVQVKLDFGEGTPLPPANRRNGTMAFMDGPVREAAAVYINGKRAGAVWSSPYTVNVTGLLKAGQNQIRIVVGNLAVNQMAAKPLPNYRETYKELIEKYGDRFQPQDMNDIRVTPSGILGPVRLVAITPGA